MKYLLMTAVTALALSASTVAQEKKGPDTKLDSHKDLAAALARADKVILHEGLPHQGFEKDLLEKELKEKKTERIQGFPYYSETLTPKEADAKAITGLFSEVGSFKPFSGEKKCGGFHPDYLVEWKVGTDTYQAAICFGCHEVKVYGPKMETRWDIDKAAYEKLQETLKPYRKNRPMKG